MYIWKLVLMKLLLFYVFYTAVLIHCTHLVKMTLRSV